MNEIEARANQWSIKIWYYSGVFETVRNITRTDAETIGVEAETNDRVQSWEIHAPSGQCVDAGRH